MSQLYNQVLQLNVYLQPLQFLLSITTNTLNIYILSSGRLRSSSCTQYFIAYAALSIIYTLLICPSQFLRGFSIYMESNPIGCRLRFYILSTPTIVARMMLVLASFNRYCSSCPITPLDSKNAIRKARLLIISVTIACIIYMLPSIIVYYGKESSGACLQTSDLISYIYISSQIFLYYIVAPLLMIIFGLITIYNARESLARIQAHENFVRRVRIERQLTRMLLLQVSIHLVFGVPFAVIYSMNSFDSSTITPNILAVRYVFVTWQQCDYFISFFLYIISGKAYRKQLVRILKCMKFPTRIMPLQEN